MYWHAIEPTVSQDSDDMWILFYNTKVPLVREYGGAVKRNPQQ